MALNDLQLFDEFALTMLDGTADHDLTVGGDTVKFAFVTGDTETPIKAYATPTWSDFSTDDCAATGGYTAAGETLANQTYTEAAGVATFDADDVALSQDPSGFEDARWGIIYNDTSSTKACIGFVDMGSDTSEVAGPITIAFNASGIFTATIGTA